MDKVSRHCSLHLQLTIFACHHSAMSTGSAHDSTTHHDCNLAVANGCSSFISRFADSLAGILIRSATQIEGRLGECTLPDRSVLPMAFPQNPLSQNCFTTTLPLGAV